MKKISEKSVGIIPIYYKNNLFHECLLIKHAKGHWGFPKGHPKTNETLQETALRELSEETGISNLNVLENIIFLEKYSFREKDILIEKEVLYFLGKLKSKEKIKLPKEEIIDYKWATLQKALEIINFKEGKNLIKNIEKNLANLYSEKYS
ncbi:bis(5'-nucleosyl)-tetraphosphatase [bacterium]